MRPAGRCLRHRCLRHRSRVQPGSGDRPGPSEQAPGMADESSRKHPTARAAPSAPSEPVVGRLRAEVLDAELPVAQARGAEGPRVRPAAERGVQAHGRLAAQLPAPDVVGQGPAGEAKVAGARLAGPRVAVVVAAVVANAQGYATAGPPKRVVVHLRGRDPSQRYSGGQVTLQTVTVSIQWLGQVAPNAGTRQTLQGTGSPL